MARSTFVYVTYIRTRPEKLWSALTDAQLMKQYWFGMHGESDWTAGSSWQLVSGDGQVFDAGEIVEADPPRRLVIRWQHQNKPEIQIEGASLCTMELEQSGTAVKLSITHTRHAGTSLPSDFVDASGAGTATAIFKEHGSRDRAAACDQADHRRDGGQTHCASLHVAAFPSRLRAHRAPRRRARIREPLPTAGRATSRATETPPPPAQSPLAA